MAGEIFISYRRADAAWARLLHSQLRAEGVEAWYDAHVGAGEDWRIATAKALETSRIFVLLFSSNAAESSDIAKELAAAVLEKKQIVPVRLENIAPKGAFLYELASRNWVNAYENTEAKLAELARGLAHLVRTGARDESVLPFDRSGDGKHIPPPPRKWRRKPALIAAAAVAVIAASAIAALLLWPAPRWIVESSRPLISTVAQEGEPAFSPDGKMLAYASGDDALSHKIYVRNLAGGDGIKITTDVNDDVSPSWSSDGARIAYVARKTGEPCRIMVVTVPAGDAREAGRCAQAETSSVTWQPGTQFLYYTDRSGEAGSVIVRLDLGTGDRLQIVASNQAETTLGDLRCSPDGTSLLYIRQQNGAPEPIVVRDLASGIEKNLGDTTGTTGSNGSAAWSEDSQTVLVTLPSGIGTKIIAYPVAGAAAYSVYATATIASHLTLGGGLLALETDSRRANLARASMAPAAQPEIIDPANGITSAPTFAPDGTLAFISNRSGTNAVWIMKPGAVPTLLFDFGLRRIAGAQFSPDGTRLAVGVASLARGVSSPPSGNGTFKILTPDGANVASLDVPPVGVGSPTWTPDGKGLVVGDRRARQAIRIAIDKPSQRAPVAAAGWVGVAMHGDAIFAIRSDKPGLWRIDKTPELISAKYPAGGPTLAFRGDDVLIPDYYAEGGPRILAQPLAGGPDRILAYAPGIQSKIAVNPRTGEMIYGVIFHNSNIDLLTLTKH
jgi:Tol biopolymer transport system component